MQSGLSKTCQIFLACAVTVVAFPVAVHGQVDYTPQSEVIILSTLHQLHEEIEGYSFRDLSDLIEQLDPDLLAVELTAQDIETRREQTIKKEYQESVFPLLAKHNYAVIPLEPSQPLFDEIVGLVRNAQSTLSERQPDRIEAFGIYSDTVYEMLREEWTSPEAVNSPNTDRLFESKHRFQDALFGPMEAEGWQRWNQHFLDQIINATKNSPGKRLVVLVGVEHAYWLRKNLKAFNLSLPDTEALIRCGQNCE